MEIEHGEVTVGALRLSAVTGKYHVCWLLGKSYYLQPRTTDMHADRTAGARCRSSYGRVVGIIHPIDVGSHIERHPVCITCAGLEVGHCLLKGTKNMLVFTAFLLRQGSIKLDILLIEHDLLVLVDDICSFEDYRIAGI